MDSRLSGGEVAGVAVSVTMLISASLVPAPGGSQVPASLVIELVGLLSTLHRLRYYVRWFQHHPIENAALS